MATHSSTLAWKIPWAGEPGRLQSMGSLRVGHNWLHFHFSLSCIGEGNGNPLQCSCLESPRDGGAWWAAVYGVSQSRTRLKRLSSSSSSTVRMYNVQWNHTWSPVPSPIRSGKGRPVQRALGMTLASEQTGKAALFGRNWAGQRAEHGWWAWYRGMARSEGIRQGTKPAVKLWRALWTRRDGPVDKRKLFQVSQNSVFQSSPRRSKGHVRGRLARIPSSGCLPFKPWWQLWSLS